MRDGSPHWGSLEIGAQETGQSSLRNMIKSEISDTRAFVERLYADFTRGGRRTVAARLVESRGGLPWLIAVHKPGRLTRR